MLSIQTYEEKNIQFRPISEAKPNQLGINYTTNAAKDKLDVGKSAAADTLSNQSSPGKIAPTDVSNPELSPSKIEPNNNNIGETKSGVRAANQLLYLATLYNFEVCCMPSKFGASIQFIYF